MMRSMRLAVALLVLSAGSALAQTSTPTVTATSTKTSTPTVTATATATRTPSVGTAKTPGTTDFAAFKHGAFKMDPTCSALAIEHFTVPIPGLKIGDLIVVYTNFDFTGTLSWNIITNGKLGVTTSCSTDSASHDWEYVWFARTQNNCVGQDNCVPAATVTPTP